MKIYLTSRRFHASPLSQPYRRLPYHPPIIDSLRSSLLPVQSFPYKDDGEDILPDDLFGGKAPIRCLQFIGWPHCVPHWLLLGVTHFTTTEPTLSELLDALRQMPCTYVFGVSTSYPELRGIRL
jgi:hypothetical protein